MQVLGRRAAMMENKQAYILTLKLVSVCTQKALIQVLLFLRLTWVCCLLLLVVMDNLILIGHLHILIFHIITATQQEKEDTADTFKYSGAETGAENDTKWRAD